MITKDTVFFYLVVLFCLSANAQNISDSLHINFKVNFNKKPLEFHQQYITSNNDTLTLTAFKCYLSNIEIHYSDKTVLKQKNSYHLLDFENPTSLQIPITKINNKSISKIIFNIGIDSLTNSAGALSGDLDPTKGMYWAWQSGYINMKIEGKSSSCNTRKNEFQFHLGGYLQPYYAMRKVAFNVNDNRHITIGIEMASFFAAIKLSETNSIMIPGKTAMQLADYSTQMFYIE
jgi:hypothetical protein